MKINRFLIALLFLTGFCLISLSNLAYGQNNSAVLGTPATQGMSQKELYESGAYGENASASRTGDKFLEENSRSAIRAEKNEKIDAAKDDKAFAKAANEREYNYKIADIEAKQKSGEISRTEANTLRTQAYNEKDAKDSAANKAMREARREARSEAYDRRGMQKEKGITADTQIMKWEDPASGAKVEFVFDKSGQAVTVYGVTQGCIPFGMKLAEAQNCIFCPLFTIIFNASQVMATLSYAKVAIPLSYIVLIGMALFLSLKVLKLVSAMTQQDIRKFLEETLAQVFKVLIAYLLLISSKHIYYYAIGPILSAGLEFGSAMMFNVDTAITCAGLPNNGDAGVIPTYLHVKIDCFIRAVQTEIAKVQALGSTLMCVSRNAGKWDVIVPNLIWDFGMLIQGMVIWVFAVAILLAFAFYLIDAVVRLGIFGALLPFGIVCWPFAITKEYSGKIWNMFMNTFFTFLFMGIVVSVNMQLIKQSFSGAPGGYDEVVTALNGDDIAHLKELLEIGFGGFLMMIACCIFGFKVCAQAVTLAESMAASSSGGNIGSKIGGLAASAGKKLGDKGARLGMKGLSFGGQKFGKFVGGKYRMAKLKLGKNKFGENELGGGSGGGGSGGGSGGDSGGGSGGGQGGNQFNQGGSSGGSGGSRGNQFNQSGGQDSGSKGGDFGGDWLNKDGGGSGGQNANQGEITRETKMLNDNAEAKKLRTRFFNSDEGQEMIGAWRAQRSVIHGVHDNLAVNRPMLEAAEKSADDFRGMVNRAVDPEAKKLWNKSAEEQGKNAEKYRSQREALNKQLETEEAKWEKLHAQYVQKEDAYVKANHSDPNYSKEENDKAYEKFRQEKQGGSDDNSKQLNNVVGGGSTVQEQSKAPDGKKDEARNEKKEGSESKKKDRELERAKEEASEERRRADKAERELDDAKREEERARREAQEATTKAEQAENKAQENENKQKMAEQELSSQQEQNRQLNETLKKNENQGGGSNGGVS